MWEIWSSKAISNLGKPLVTEFAGTALLRYESSDSQIEWLRREFQDEGSFLVKKISHRPKALVFDMDSTLIHQETIVELARAAGKSKEVEAITERAMAGELNFDEALKERVSALKGLHSEILDETRKHLTLFQGVEHLINYAKELGITTHVVSGGFEEIACPLLLPLGFSSVRGNRLEALHGKLTGRVLGSIFNGESKKTRLLEICQEASVSPSDVAAIGDGANDLPMMARAGFALGFNPKPIVVKQATGVNRTGDHRFWIKALFNP